MAIGPELAGAGIAFAGFLIGRYLPARRRGPKPPKPAQPVCGCKHHRSFHDPKTGNCHGQVYRGGTGIHVSCTCRQYSGPVPLPEYYASEIEGE